MSRVNVDSDAFTDARFLKLGRLFGVHRAHAVGAMARVWLECTNRGVSVLPADDVDCLLQAEGLEAPLKQRLSDASPVRLSDGSPGCLSTAVDALVFCGLAEKIDSGIRISGAEKRCLWLEQKREAGRKGGQKTQKTRPNPAESGKQRENQAALKRRGQAALKRAGVPSCSGSGSGSGSKKQPPEGPPGGPNSDSQFSDSENPKTKKPDRDSRVRAFRQHAASVLDLLSQTNGVKYRASLGHTRLILARVDELRAEGMSLDDAVMALRSVVAYCASDSGLGWGGEHREKMRAYLRPETLFGKQNIERYLDPALTWDGAKTHG